MPNLPEKLVKLLKEVDITQHKAVWDCHGTPVLLHKALEKIAAHHNIVFDAPQIISCDVSAKEAVICVTGHMKDATEWSIGEAAPYNNKNSYPFAMAEKRAKDRVILKLVGLHGDVYSEEEADDFKSANPQEQEFAVANIQEKVDAWLEFFETCGWDKFKANQTKFKKFLNNPSIDEDQYNQLIDARDKLNKEFGVE
jgi:hypothetical protein